MLISLMRMLIFVGGGDGKHLRPRTCVSSRCGSRCDEEQLEDEDELNRPESSTTSGIRVSNPINQGFRNIGLKVQNPGLQVKNPALEVQNPGLGVLESSPQGLESRALSRNPGLEVWNSGHKGWNPSLKDQNLGLFCNPGLKVQNLGHKGWNPGLENWNTGLFSIIQASRSGIQALRARIQASRTGFQDSFL